LKLHHHASLKTHKSTTVKVQGGMDIHSLILLYSEHGGNFKLTPWNKIFEMLIGAPMVKKYQALYGNQRFTTKFIKARHWTTLLLLVTLFVLIIRNKLSYNELLS
jgi:hypothetical protein